MRVAVLSDIHGFSIALEHVLDDIEQAGEFDEIIVAGDLCEVGPAPEDVLELLQSRKITVLQGNTDFDIVESARMHRGIASHDYAVAKIGEAGVEYLAALPFSRRVSPLGGRPELDDLLVVHANPHNLLDRLDPASSDRELLETIGETRAAAIAFGHIHICYTRNVGDFLLVDVSAVGNSKDGDLRCKYGVIAWDATAKSWSAEIRKLPYPLDETEAQIKSSDLPNPEKVFKKLKKATY